ncbi:ribonuclease H2, subunit C, partial [Phaeosphaeriaceae sp. PMI808]
MLAIHPTKPNKCTPNLLPCRINHNGPINDTQKYFVPQTDAKNAQHVYFRGRHLHGTTLPLPERYTGAVINMTDRPLPESEILKDDEDDAHEQIKIAEQIGHFEDIMVWEHGSEVDQRSGVVRAVREWIGFAESMHCEKDQEKDT